MSLHATLLRFFLKQWPKSPTNDVSLSAGALKSFGIEEQ